MSGPVNTLLTQARRNHHRSLLVLSGTESFVLQKAYDVVQSLDDKQGLWIGDSPADALPQLPASKAGSWLGRELDLIVFNAFSGFDVDAFGAISGTLKGGGLMVLLAPELDQWHRFKDPEHKRLAVYPVNSEDVTGLYLKRLARLILESKQCSRISEQDGAEWYYGEPNAEVGTDRTGSLYRTDEQCLAVEAIIRVAKGHRRRPLVLTADRGRGKSAAAGIAAAELLAEGLKHIAVTAPSLKSVEVMFHHAAARLEWAEVGRGVIQWQGKTLQFFAPDELACAERPIERDLMLVDEAAALPVPILTRLLQDNARIVFASTIHGYEGTGRGFSIKFKKILDRVTPKWRGLHIRQPVRWRENDPLERFVFGALLLNAAPAEPHLINGANPGSCTFERLDRQTLIHQPEVLNELFGLLVLAHYQTSPFDLRHLLDGPNIEVFVLKHNGHIAGTVLAALEGGITLELEDAVWLGRRRVTGHLLPQSLSNHVGLPEAIRYKGLRILRIAVHPEIQNRELGQYMLECLSQEVTHRRLDFLGSSFGATRELVQFWKKAGFVPVRTGLVREASSGCYSMMVLKSVSTDFSALALEVEQRMKDSLLQLLPETLKSMETDLVLALLQGMPTNELPLTPRDHQDLISFAESDRLYESCLVAIRKLLLHSIPNASVNCKTLLPLIGKVLQHHSWEQLARDYRLTGKKQAVQLLKKSVKYLVKS